MTQYETLLKTAANSDIMVYEKYHFDSDRIKGLYCDNAIAISKNIETESERICILAEELGHHFTTSGDILDMKRAENRKQERKARLWAYETLFDVRALIKAYEKGCRNCFEIAEHLGITEDFLLKTISTLKEKYGQCLKTGDYIIYFEPLGIYKKFK